MIGINVKDSGWKFNLINATENSVKRALKKSIKVVADESRRLCPIDKGNLVKAIKEEVDEKAGKAYVYVDQEQLVADSDANEPYDEFVEFGTYKMYQQSFMRAGLDNKTPDVLKIFESEFKKEYR